MISGHNELTEQKRKALKQGTKVRFQWYGSKQIYTGRIELDKEGDLYFVNEFNYEGDTLLNEGLRYYNPLDSFFFFTLFEIIG